jgi:hypothetical protein
MSKTEYGDRIEEEGEVFIEHVAPHPYDSFHHVRIVICGVCMFETIELARGDLRIQPPSRMADTIIGSSAGRWYITLEDAARFIEDAWPSE